MSGDEPKAWAYSPHALTVLPGVTWEEWSELWSAVEQTHKSAAFWSGDALLAGQREFGERFSQVVDPKYIHQQKGPMWVCARIEPSRRRASLSYSLHKLLAALERAEQERWLDRAEAEAWSVRELKAAMDAEARGRGNGGPPLDDAPPTPIEGEEEDIAGSTWNDYSPEPELDPDTFGSVEEVTGEPFQSPPASEEPPAAPETPPGPLPASTGHETPAMAQIRACIEDLRAMAPTILRTHVDKIVRMEDRITQALGWEAGSVSLLHTDVVLELLPKGWDYSVTLTKPGGERIAVGLGPSLACAVLEAILAARLSDMGTG